MKMLIMALAMLADVGATQEREQSQAPVQAPSQPVPAIGRVANSANGEAGVRRTGQQLLPQNKPMSRLNNRIQSRVQSRLRNRLDPSYDPQADTSEPFAAAARVRDGTRR